MSDDSMFSLELPTPQAPMEVARVLVKHRYTDGQTGALTLRHWRGGWWEWRISRWAEVGHRAVRAAAYEFTEYAVYRKLGKAKASKTAEDIAAGDMPDDDGEGDGDKLAEFTLTPWMPNRSKIADLLEALAAVCHLPDTVNQPTWLDIRRTGVIVSCANGLLDVQRRELLRHTPQFFNGVAVPFAYDPDAPDPVRWKGFLNDLWPDDEKSEQVLSEWFGYVVSGRTSLQKILLVVGPTRGGKGAIARILSAMVGRQNVAGPTLSSLSGDFGLAPLIGKPLAVVSDARLNGRDSSTVVERLLSVSGEDRLTVNVKYREQWSGTLPSRFVLLSNELPQLGDASAAIAGRFVTLLLERSWLGKEDHTLEPELHTELPGILNWALDGLARLEAQNAFTRPPGADEAYKALVDLASPVKAFIRDACLVGPGQEVTVDEFFKAWKQWAEDNGHPKKTKQTLGRDLRAALPRVRIARPRAGEERVRRYEGVGLKKEGT